MVSSVGNSQKNVDDVVQAVHQRLEFRSAIIKQKVGCGGDYGGDVPY